MHTRIVKVRIAEGRWDEFLAAYLEHVDGRDDIEVGMVHRYIVRDVEDPHVGLLMSVWETADDMVRYAEHPFHAAFGEIVPGAITSAEVTHGEVVHERRGV
ncbi:MAG: antibiotic biosynthesis monooxygenase [Acidimicrobiales bacterium]